MMAPDNDARDNDAKGPTDDDRLANGVRGVIRDAEVEKKKRGARGVTLLDE